MDSIKIKQLIKSNRVTNAIAEILLDIIVVVRALMNGGYAGHKEDLIAQKILTEKFYLPVDKIKYVDIGANNFRRGNNTYLLYKQGARGLLIEADPMLCKALKDTIRGDKVLNVAVGTENIESVDFYVLSLPTRSSLDEGQINSALKSGLKIKEIVKIPCMNLNDLFAEQNFEPDFMSIDIEGLDYKVLRSLDFNKYKVKVIIAERSSQKNEAGETMNVFMERIGYNVYGEYGSNVIYVRKCS